MLPPIDADFPDVLAGLDLPRVPQQARSRQKRDALLAAAARLFAERGYEATTADEIAAAADVSIGTFYAYFRNKRQLFLTLYAACIESFLDLGLTEVDFTREPLKAVRETVHRALQRDALSYGLRRAWAELLPRDPEIAAYNDQTNTLIYRQILFVVRRLAEQGLTWPGLDIEPTCWLITLMLDQQWSVEPEPSQTTEAETVRRRDAIAVMIYHALFRSA